MTFDKEELETVALALRHSIWAGEQQLSRDYIKPTGFAWFATGFCVRRAKEVFDRVNAELKQEKS